MLGFDMLGDFRVHLGNFLRRFKQHGEKLRRDSSRSSPTQNVVMWLRALRLGGCSYACGCLFETSGAARPTRRRNTSPSTSARLRAASLRTTRLLGFV